jgi:hypothetical protein
MQPPIWEQQPEESAKAYAAFTTYRDLLPNQRSIDTAWRATNEHRGTLLAGLLATTGRLEPKQETENRQKTGGKHRNPCSLA